jgi:hypothetical protein
MKFDADKCKRLLENAKKDELKAVIEINNEIAKRTSYGIREEIIQKNKSTFMLWSNASEAWIPAHPDSGWGKNIRAGNEVKLDANHVVVPFPYSVVKKFNVCYRPLPLYGLSFEAKNRGQVESFEATFCWAIKQYERIESEKWREKNR